jgi:hypothetical protein
MWRNVIRNFDLRIFGLVFAGQLQFAVEAKIKDVYRTDEISGISVKGQETFDACWRIVAVQ